MMIPFLLVAFGCFVYACRKVAAGDRLWEGIEDRAIASFLDRQRISYPWYWDRS